MIIRILLLAAFCGLVSIAEIAFANEDNAPIIVTWEPSVVNVRFIGSTETISYTISNNSNETIEFPSARWLIVQRADSPTQPLWTPRELFYPFYLLPKEKITVVWRVTENIDVQLASGITAKPSAVFAGEHHIIIYYRPVGAEAFKTVHAAFNVVSDTGSTGGGR